MIDPNGAHSEQTRAGTAAPIVVGVGAPAGGPGPVQPLLMRLSAKPEGVAFVLVQQEDPKQHQLAIEPLRKSTTLRVVEATDGLGIESGTVYVAPPRTLLQLKGNRLQLQSLSAEEWSTTRVDQFLCSLAEEQGPRSIGILLPGVGVDGTWGLKAISDAGGMTIAAADIHNNSAAHATAATIADHVLSPEQIVKELEEYVQHLDSVSDMARQQQLRKQITCQISTIAALLNRATGHDFQHYKSTTLVRRIQRRMQVLKLLSADDYVTLLSANSDEVQALFRELLIGVTAFFRDPDAFTALAASALSQIFADVSRRPVRIWVPGCATGEEAYTIAMLCCEQMDRLSSPVEVQIFATDIDERALRVARAGSYPLSVQHDLTQERLERFFVRRGKRLMVNKALRDMVLFSTHNLVSDPPFSRQDLISCRNLLIYFGQPLQAKLVPLFHYALRPGGYLFLGPSENVSTHRELFRPVDAKQRISQRKESSAASETPFATRDEYRSESMVPPMPSAEAGDLQHALQKVLLDDFAPKTVIVDEEGQILCASGSMDKYLTVSGGSFQNNVIKMARPELRIGVRAAFQQAVRTSSVVRHEHLSLPVEGGLQRVMLTVQPFSPGGDTSGLYLLAFQDIGLPQSRNFDLLEPRTSPADTIIDQLERELAHTRRDLENSMQNMESANEELKSSNEELLSINEELQSANEELAASQEEVQAGLEALAHANTDLENLLRSTQIATLFLDGELRIRSFTPAATAIYALIDSDIGRPLSDLMPLADDVPPLPDPESVTEESAIEDTIVARSGRSYIRRVLPYRDHTGHRDGVVVTFLEVTELRDNEQRLQESTTRLRLAMEAGRMAPWQWDGEHGLSSDELFALLGIASGSPRRTAEDFFSWVHPQDVAAVREAWDRAVQGTARYKQEFRIVRPDGEVRWLASIGESVKDVHGRVTAIHGISWDVTEQRKKADDVRLARERLERVVDTAEFGIAFSHGSGAIIRPNDAFLLMLGCSREEFERQGLHWRDITHPDDLELAEKHLRKLLQTGTSGNYEKRLMRRDGTIIPVMINRQLVSADENEHVAFIADLTLPKAQEQRIRASEHFVRKTLDSLYTFAGVCLADGTLIEVNRPTLDAAGLEPEDVLGLPFENTYWFSHDVAVQRQLRAALDRAAAGESSRYDVEIRVAEDRKITIDFQLMPMRDDDGRVTHLIPSGVDITERKEAEDELRRSEARLRATFENAAVGIARVGPDGSWLSVNRRLCEIVGYSREELLQLTFQDITHPEDLEPDLALVSALMRGEGDEYQLEKRYIHKDGGIVWIHLTVAIQRELSGEPVHFIAVVQDITERKRAERAARESESRLQVALTAGRMGTFEWEVETGKAKWSAEHYSLLGFEPFSFEPTYEFFRSCVHPDDLPEVDAHVQTAWRTGSDYQFEFRVVRPDSKEHWLLARGQCEVDTKGSSVRMFGVIVDYHEIKQSHVELHKAREIAEAASQSRGEFLANMSHEIRTPMTAILGYADILAKHLDDPDDLVCVDTICRNGRFLLDIINDILDLSKIDAGKLDVETQRVPPPAIMEDVLSLMEVRALEKGLCLKVEYDGPLPETIETDPKRLRQVLLNLVGNAVKFTDTGSVRLRVQALPDHQLIQFDVIDTGIGIAPEHLSRLFQPFTQADASTTRSFGGTGLGLTISRRLTQMLGGDIHVHSELGAGSTFTVTIGTGPLDGVPLVTPMRDIAVPSTVRTAEPQKLRGRVLVVDDRREIRYLAQHFLEDAGCEVATAIHGENALEMVAQADSEGRPFDLVLIDMQMPVMDGYRATAELRARHFNKPIVALTAHAMQGDREACLRVGCTDYATKPLDGLQLIQIIGRYLPDGNETM